MSEAKEIRHETAKAQVEFQKLQDEGASPTVLAAMESHIAQLQRDLAEAEAEELRRIQEGKNEDAYYSPLGKVITAVFDATQYDYADVGDYPGLVEAAEKVLNELGYALVKNDAAL